jgi:3-phosphoshikimate 1-carboxyvinyltransferase
VPLPDVIEIVPLTKPVWSVVTVPGSKSITNRALILAALADGETTLEGALWSEDTQIMVECLQELGFMINVTPDARETCNRTVTVYGQGGNVPRGGTREQPLDLYVGNAGTAARFLTAMVCLGQGAYRLHGVPRMHERPQAALFQSLRQLGYEIDSPNDRLPAVVVGGGPRPGTKCRVSLEQSSQFASALLLCGDRGGWRIEMSTSKGERDFSLNDLGQRLALETGAGANVVTSQLREELPYVVMSAALRLQFRQGPRVFRVEPDASSGSYFWGAAALTLPPGSPPPVRDWPVSGWQVDADFPKFLPLPSSVSREGQLADSIMTGVILAPFAGHPVHFTNLGRLRVQECERVVALRTELSRCGAEVLEVGDTLTVSPSVPDLHGATIETYHDHRMAMCFAILGLKVAGLKIKNPACVKKTFPNFFQKLAAPPPHGLGVVILDGTGTGPGRPLAGDELFAD